MTVTTGPNDPKEYTDKLFEQLFKGIPARPEPPADSDSWVYEQFQQNCKQLKTRKARRLRNRIWAIAASLFALALMLLLVTEAGGAPGDSGVIGTVHEHTHQVAFRQLAEPSPIFLNPVRRNS